jgi:hypothetical protein
MLDIIYPDEIDIIRPGKTIAYCPVLPAEHELKNAILSKANLSLFNRPESDRWDLFPFYSILVSVGWNKNRDVFDPIELWRARHSPEDKPLNWMHNPNKIVGHITDNIVVDEDLKPIHEDTKEEDLPYRLHVVTANVLYRISDDVAQQSWIEKIIGQINNGKLYVSMECLFRSFDFLLLGTTGEQKLIPRNEKSAFLTKHLLQYGGDGKYRNYTMGRLLRNITFSAQGLVDNPANPDSIISNNLDSTFTSLGYINSEPLCEEKFMAEAIATLKEFDIENNSAYKALKAQLEDLRSQNCNLKIELNKAVNEKFDAKDDELKEEKEKNVKAATRIVELEKTIADSNLTWEGRQEESKKVHDQITNENASLKAEVDALKKTVDEYKKASRAAQRSAALKSVDKSLSDAKAIELANKFIDLHDDSFAALVSTMASYASKAPKQVTAEDVVNKTKAEEAAPPLGTKADLDEKTVASDVINWFKCGRKK